MWWTNSEFQSYCTWRQPSAFGKVTVKLADLQRKLMLSNFQRRMKRASIPHQRSRERTGTQAGWLSVLLIYKLASQSPSPLYFQCTVSWYNKKQLFYQVNSMEGNQCKLLVYHPVRGINNSLLVNCLSQNVMHKVLIGWRSITLLQLKFLNIEFCVR